MAFFDALGQQNFLLYALLAGWLASLGCGVMGSYVVVKRIGYLAGSIAHTVLGGMGFAYYLGVNPLYGALISAILAALLIGWVSLKYKHQEDTLTGALFALGMATGVLFISQTPGYNVDLMSYLFGNILMVTEQQLLWMGVADAIILLLVVIFYPIFQALCLDEEFAHLRGISVAFFYMLLLCMVAITVVLLIQVVGLILVIALLTLPAAIASQYAGRLVHMMVGASCLGVFFTSGGLVVSYEYDLPAGASMVVLAGVVYLLSSFITYLKPRWSGLFSARASQQEMNPHE